MSKPFILALAPFKIPEAERKLLAWWKFDETEGDSMNDSSDNNFSGTLVGGPQWQPDGGKVGGALVFDGVDDYVDCGTHDDLNLTNAVSVSAWIKLAGPAEDQKIVGNQDDLSGGYKVSIYKKKVELEIRDSGNRRSQNRSVKGGTLLESDTWYHVVATYCQGGSIKTYVNAKLDRERVPSGTLASSAGALKIGCEPFQDLYWFNGLMDDLQIYNYPLTETEIAAIYSGEGPRMVAQIQAPAVSAEESGKTGKWIPVSVIVAVAIAAGALVARKKKMTA